MDKKLFTEDSLKTGLPEDVIAQIEKIAGKISHSVLDDMLASAEMQQFGESLTIPRVENYSHTSVLLRDVKRKLVVGKDKQKKPSKKGGQKERKVWRWYHITNVQPGSL